MAAVRDKINRVKVEGFKSRVPVPIDPTETVYQGDAMVWDAGNHVATKAGPSATAFIGVSETTNPIATLGSPDLLGNLTDPRVNIIQAGMVERIAEHAETLQPFDTLTVGSDAQKVSHLWATNATMCYIVDPKWAQGGKLVAAGDLVRCWIKPRPAYSVCGQASAALS